MTNEALLEELKAIRTHLDRACCGLRAVDDMSLKLAQNHNEALAIRGDIRAEVTRVELCLSTSKKVDGWH